MTARTSIARKYARVRGTARRQYFTERRSIGALTREARRVGVRGSQNEATKPNEVDREPTAGCDSATFFGANAGLSVTPSVAVPRRTWCEKASSDVRREALTGASAGDRVDARQILPQKLNWPTVNNPAAKMPAYSHVRLVVAITANTSGMTTRPEPERPDEPLRLTMRTARAAGGRSRRGRRSPESCDVRRDFLCDATRLRRRRIRGRVAAPPEGPARSAESA